MNFDTNYMADTMIDSKSIAFAMIAITLMGCASSPETFDTSPRNLVGAYEGWTLYWRTVWTKRYGLITPHGLFVDAPQITYLTYLKAPNEARSVVLDHVAWIANSDDTFYHLQERHAVARDVLQIGDDLWIRYYVRVYSGCVEYESLSGTRVVDPRRPPEIELWGKFDRERGAVLLNKYDAFALATYTFRYTEIPYGADAASTERNVRPYVESLSDFLCESGIVIQVD